MANQIEVTGVPKSSNEMEQWLSQGRTFDSASGRWYEAAQTASAPQTNTSYLNNLLSVASDRGLDVSQILTNPNYVPPKTETPKYDYSAATSSADVLAQQLKDLQAQKDAAAKKMEEAGKTAATDAASLIASYKPPTIDITGATTTAEQKYGTEEALSKMQTQNAKVAALQGELEKLNTEELTAVDTAEGRVASRGAIEGEKDTITRAYNIKKAYKSAELYAEAAVAQVYSNNYTEAQNLVIKAVNAYTTEIKQEIDNYNNLFSLQSDFINSLDTKEQNLLQAKYNELVQKEEILRNEKTNVLNLALQYPNAGITISDTMESAVKKAQPYEAAAQAAKADPSMTDENIDGWVNYLMDQAIQNPIDGLSKAISSIPSALRGDVITAYYLQQAEADRPKQEFLNNLKNSNITPELLKQGYDLGLTLDGMKAAIPERVNEIIQAQHESSIPYKVSEFTKETVSNIDGELYNVLAPVDYWLKKLIK